MSDINGRPDLTYLTQTKFEFYKELEDSIHLFVKSKKQSKTFAKIDIDSEFMNAIENIPALVQIAEMFYDQMKSRNEKSICFEIVESTLNKLRNEK